MTLTEAKVVRVPQRSPAWLDWRRSHINSSDAPIIAGESPYRSPFDLFMEKTQGVREVDAATQRLFRIGHATEPLILDLYAEETGRKVRPGRVLEWRQWPVLGASLDGEAEDRIVEAKWTSSARWDGGVPGDVLVQVTHQMGVSGYRVADVAVLTGRTFTIHEVPFDPALWESLLVLHQDFDRRCREDDPPPVDGSEATRKALVALHPEDNGEWMDPDPDIESVVRRLLEEKRVLAEAESRVGTLENTLRFVLEAHAGCEGPGWKVTYKRTKDSTRVAWESLAGSMESIIRESAPDRLAEVETLRGIYTTVQPGTRRLLVKGTEVTG